MSILAVRLFDTLYNIIITRVGPAPVIQERPSPDAARRRGEALLAA